MGKRRTSFMGALSPVLAVSRAAGVFVLDRDMNFSRLLYGYSLVIGILCMFYRIYFALFLRDFVSDFVILGSLLTSQVCILMSWLVFYRYSPLCRDFREAVLLLDSASRTTVFQDSPRKAFSKHPSRTAASFQYPWLCYSVILLKLVFFVLIIVTREIDLVRIIAGVINALCQVPIDVLLTQFAVFVHLTTQIINRHLQELESRELDEKGEILIRFRTVCRRFEAINAYYSPSILLAFANVFANLPPFCYTMMVFYAYGLFFIIFLGSQMIGLFYVAFVVAHTCSALKRKVLEFNSKVHEKIKIHQHLRENEKIIMFLEYNPQIKPKCATFFLDYPIIIELISTCLSYMVILFQFGKQRMQSNFNQSNRGISQE